MFNGIKKAMFLFGVGLELSAWLHFVYITASEKSDYTMVLVLCVMGYVFTNMKEPK